MRADFEFISPSPRRQRVRRVLIGSLATALLLTSLMVSPAFAHQGKPKLGDPTVIASWNLLAEQTFLADPAKKPTEAFLYLGFVEAAVYDAVVGIDGRYQPYSLHAHAPRGASDQAAAVAAAHKVATTFSPYAQS